MKPPLPRIQTAVPRSPHVHLEIAKAIRALMGPDEDELARARRTEIAAIRHDLEALARDIPKAFEEAAKEARAELWRLTLAKTYNPNQPRVPAGSRDGGQWTSGSKAGTSTPSKVRYAANGDFPPAPEGYDPNTWKQGNWPNNNKLYLQDPDGNKYTLHPEDDRHWRHWDKQDGDGNDQGRSPPNAGKPRENQKRLKPSQSWTDPNGDAPPWTPNPLVPTVPEPILPAQPVPTPKAPIEEIPLSPRILFPRIFFPG